MMTPYDLALLPPEPSATAVALAELAAALRLRAAAADAMARDSTLASSEAFSRGHALGLRQAADAADTLAVAVDQPDITQALPPNLDW